MKLGWCWQWRGQWPCRWRSTAAAALLGLVASTSMADGAPAVPAVATDPRRSGAEFMSPQTQAMQRDDMQNPAMLWAADGEALWAQPPAPGSPACASCHGAAPTSMRGVAARYPRFDDITQRPLSLRDRIAACRERHQHATPWSGENQAQNQAWLALETWVALQSRGLPLQPDTDSRLAPWRERGGRLFGQRIGQLDLSCAQCHDQNAGRRLGGSVIPQAHPTGYPVYRLEWQGVGTLLRRLRNCMTGVRAEPFAPGAPEWVELELFLVRRAAGMPMESPGVRP